MAHLNRLRERASTPPATLRQSCRFESDIGTTPPAGVVALTFDDGPDPEHTAQILNVLARFDAPATFFFIGEKMHQYPEVVQMVRQAKQHLIASHSWSHPNFHELGDDNQRAEILRGIEPMPADLPARLFRYPYGNSSCFGNEVVHSPGYKIAGWHVDSCDWAFDRTGRVALHEAVSCGVAPQHRGNFVGHVLSALRERHGGILLMHEIHPNTLAQLGEIVEALAREGYTFARLDDARLASSMR